MKKVNAAKQIQLEELFAVEPAENSDLLGDVAVAVESAKNSEDSLLQDSLETKTPQTLEQRKMYADANRKKTIELMRQREGAVEELINSLGATGESIEERIESAQQIVKNAKQQQFEADVMKEAEQSGVAPDIIRKALLMDKLENQLHTLQWNQKTSQATEYCHAKDPCFFADLSVQDVNQLVVMIRSGFTPQQIYKTFCKEQGEGEAGISHIKAIGGAKQSGAVDVPSDVLREYERYGISHADALSDYRKQMLNRY